MSSIYEKLHQLEIDRLTRLGLITEGPGPRCDYHQVLLDARGKCSVCVENAMIDLNQAQAERNDESGMI